MKKSNKDFLSQISSGLRIFLDQILTSISSVLEKSGDALPYEIRTNLQTILFNSQEMSKLIDNLLDTERIWDKKVKLSTKAVAVKTCVEEVLNHFKAISGSASLHFIDKIAENIPPIMADEKRLHQILLNLVKVLVECTKTGFIEISAKVEHPNLMLIISSTGEIVADEIEKITKSVRQADDLDITKGAEKGFDYIIAKQLIELHGDRIRLASIPGNALKFSFKLPLTKDAIEISPKEDLQKSTIDSEHSKDEEKLTSKIPEDTHRKFKILIVDDESTVCEFLSQYLGLLNYSVTTVNNGRKALEIIDKRETPDLVLLDIMMPEMDGFEVCEKIREHLMPHELPIILLTARDKVADVVKGFDAGANDYISKPFSNNELAARIKTHLQLCHISSAYGRFVPREFLRLLGHESIVNVKLGEQVQREMTILFSDIRSFTALSENMTPKENFDFLNSYLAEVSPVIWNHNGFIDKYIGDAMMALFPNEAQDALAAAIQMIESLETFNAERQERGCMPIEIGIGLHTGSVMLGTIGYSEYMQGTVISDSVNLASRVENLTKLYGSTVLISEQTLFHLRHPEKHQYRFLDLVRVKGKKHSISVFEIFDVDVAEMIKLKQESRADFEQGVYYFHSKKFEEAYRLFKKVLDTNQFDNAAQLYIARCEKFIQGGVPEDWDGVATEDEKF